MFIIAFLLTIVIVAPILFFGRLWRLFRNSNFITKRWPLPATIAPDGWDAGRGALPGAIVGSFIFPAGPMIILTIAVFFSNVNNIEYVKTNLFEVTYLLILLFLFWIFCAIIWLLFIMLTIQIWGLVCWRRVPGPWAAAALGAASAYLTMAISALARKAPVLTIDSQIAAGYVTAAGAISGAVVWWATYRPEKLKVRCRLCPIFRHIRV